MCLELHNNRAIQREDALLLMDGVRVSYILVLRAHTGIRAYGHTEAMRFC